LIERYVERFKAFSLMLMRVTPPPIPYEISHTVAMALHPKVQSGIGTIPSPILLQKILNGRVWPPRE